MWTRRSRTIALRTVDVWDTLLRRRCHPDAVKLHVCGELLARRWSDVKPEWRTPRELLRLRFEVEHWLARESAADPARDDEYTLRDVLAEWTRTALTTPADTALLDALAQEELAQEMRVAYADPTIAATLARHPVSRTLFLTDFYLGAAEVRGLLSAKGLGAVCEDGYSSCELGVNKRSGRAYQAVQRLQGVSAPQHLHIGDDAGKDVKVPRRLGMLAERFNPWAEGRRKLRVRRYFTDRAELVSELQHRSHDIASAPAEATAAAAFRFGIDTTPLWLGHTLFILESARRQQARELWFFTREGEFFAQVYAELRAVDAPWRDRSPEPRVLEVSRAATFTASLQAPTTDEMLRLWRLFDPQTMRAWALSLDLDAALVAACCARAGLGFDEPVARPAEDARVQRLLADPACRDALVQRIHEKRAQLLDYLRGQGFAQGAGLTMIADIGWRGTIQDNLALVRPDARLAGCYLGLQRFVNPQPAGTKAAYGPDLNRSGEGARLFRNLPLLEMLSASARGSVTGYRAGAAERLDDAGESGAYAQVVRHVHAGVLHGVRTWREEVVTHAVSSDELRDAALATWGKILARPPACVRRAFRDLKHNELFGRGRFAPVAR